MIHRGLQAMSTVGSNTEDGDALRPVEPGARGARRLFRRIFWSMAAAVAAIVLMLGFGFVWFVGQVPAEEVRLEGGADGIVALTGGASRINDAIELLQKGHGRRLLISGLNRATTLSEIARLDPESARKVDFDRSLNTLGNAIETRRWADRQRFHSLIVVTSNYHMPRALAELAHQMPDVALIAFPVVTDRQKTTESWWTRGAPARLMVLEYVKLVYAKLRIRFNPDAGAGEPV
jgi:uncharacterized SAM-binding protein YcdF (DUF218 family)